MFCTGLPISLKILIVGPLPAPLFREISLLPELRRELRRERLKLLRLELLLELKLVERISALTMSKLDLRGLSLSFLLLKFYIPKVSALIHLFIIAGDVLLSTLSKLIRTSGTLFGFLADKALVTSPTLKVCAIGIRL